MEKQIKVKPLKSVLSVLLSVLIVFSGLASTTALAADETDSSSVVLQIDSVSTLGVGDYEFTPPYTGWYMFESNGSVCGDPYININDAFDDDFGYEAEFKLPIYLVAESPVTVKLGHGCGNETCRISLYISYWDEEVPPTSDRDNYYDDDYDDDYDDYEPTISENGFGAEILSETECRISYFGGDVVVDNTLTFPSTVSGYTVTEIDTEYVSFPSGITTINLPATVKNLQIWNWPSTLKQINVAEGNSVFSSYNGVLYNADKTRVELIPYAFEGELFIPKTLTEFNFGSVDVSDFKIEEGHPTYKMMNGFVCSVDGSILIKATQNVAKEFTYDQNINIAERCFAGSNIETLKIASNVTQISYSVFASCKSLKSVEIPATVKEIGQDAFSECTSLETVTLNAGLEDIKFRAFYACDALKSIVIPETVKSIGNNVFSMCSSLETATIGTGVEKIGGYAFYDCESLTNIVVPNNVKELGWAAFAYCSKLASVTLGDGLTVIPDRAFASCTALKNVTLGNNIEVLDYGCFEYCTSLTSITLPASLKEIGSAFTNCTALTSIIIPTGVKTLHGSFYNCTALKSISLPDTIVDISSSTFDNTAYYNTPSNWEDNVLYIGKYLFKANPEISGAYNIKEGTLVIADDAFLGCSNLEKVTANEGLVTVGDNAFATCSKLVKAVFKNGLTYIGNSAFIHCASLKKVILPSTVEAVGDWAFSNCPALSNISKEDLEDLEAGVVEVPGSVTEIAYGQFANCSSMTKTIIPEGVEAIQSKAYSNCSSLGSVTFPTTLKLIGYRAFGDCSALYSVALPNGIESIGGYAFDNTGYYNTDSNWVNNGLYNNNYLLAVKPDATGDYIIKDGTTLIAQSAFNESTVNSIKIPSSVTKIDDNTFRDFYTLKSIEIPNSVTYIGNQAFSSCYSLQEINIPNGVTYIGNYAFAFNNSLNKITIPDSVTEIGSGAFRESAYYENSSNWVDNTLYIGNCLIDVNYNYTGTDFVVKPGTKVIANSAFDYCDTIKTITIPDSVRKIGSNTFSDCWSLKEITIPATISSIDAGAFVGCENLKVVNFGGSKEQWKQITIGENNDELLSAEIKFAHTCDFVGKVTTEATCTKAGVKTFTCECGESYTETIPATGHSEKVLPAVGATCTATGLTEGKQCTVCGTVTVAQQTVDKKAHTEKVLPAVGATCTATGLTEGKQCTVCGTVTVAQQTVPATGHKEEVLVAVAPTCEGTGLTEGKKCTVCGVVTVAQTEVAALGHTESDWIVDKAASFSEEGSHHKECTVCKVVLAKEEIPMKALEIPVVKIENAPKGILVSWTIDGDALGYTVYRSVYDAKTKTWSKWDNRCTTKATVSSWTDIKVSNGDIYKYTVRSVNGKNISGFKETGSLVFVSTPEVKIANDATGMKVSWSKIAGATGYTVYRSELQNGAWTNWKSMGTAKEKESSWVDKSVVSGVEYKYTVRALSNKTASAFVASNTTTYLAQPVVKASTDVASINVEWAAIEGAEGYKVYRSVYDAKTEKWSKWSELGTVTTTNYVDKAVANATSYKYTARAVKGSSISTFVASNNVLFVSTPTVKIVNDATGMKVSWSKVAGATGYTVYRSELQNGAWTNWKSMGTAKADKTSWIDKSAVSGVEYKYTVRALNNKVASAFVESNSVICFHLEKPVVKASTDVACINVEWAAIEGAEGYKVYRSVYDAKTEKWSKWSELGTVTTTNYVDKAVANATSYKYTARAVKGETVSGFTASNNVLFVTTPTVKIANDATGMKVSWSKVAGATGYTVYRSELQNGAWTNWKSMGTAKADKTSWIDKSAVSGVEYKYTVRALNNKVASAFVESNSVICFHLEKPVVKASTDVACINVEWAAIEGAEGYKVYRSVYDAKTEKWSKWSELGTVTTTNYVDKAVANATSYKYTARAVKGETVSGFTASNNVLFVTTPTVKIANDATGMKVSWSKVAGATGYTVYRSELKNGEWTNWKSMGTAKADKTSWIDKSAVSGVEYKYTVRALNNKVASAFVESNSVICFHLEKPVVKASTDVACINVEWAAIEGAEGYKVYRSVYDAKTEKWSKWSELGTVTTTNYVDKAVANATSYKYTARAVKGETVSGFTASNNVLFVTTPTVKIANDATGMKVSWSKVAGATGYTVYRSELQNGAWTKWKSMGTAKADKSSWIDKSAVSGVEYKYTVRAVMNKVASAYVDSNNVIYLAQPVVKIAGCATGINVVWNGINGAQSYNVYRAEYNATTKKWSGWSVIATATETNYVDATAVSGTYYKYTVRAVNGANMSTYKATGALYYLAEPVATLTVVENGINVAWTQSAGATGYTVYRSQYDPATNTWSKWSNRGTAKANKNNWTDKKTTQGVTYKYAVRAVNGKLKSTYTETAGVTR